MSSAEHPYVAMDELFYKGEFAQMRILAEGMQDQNFAKHDANFWFNFGRSVIYTDRSEQVLASIRQKMSGCPNYCWQLGCDLTHDEIKNFIKSWAWAEKSWIEKWDWEERIIELERYCSSKKDSFRHAKALTLHGRLLYLNKRYANSLAKHRLAEKKWQDLRWFGVMASPSCTEGRAENSLFLLKAMTVNKDRDHQEIQRVAEWALKSNSRWQNLRVFLVFGLGKIGNVVDDFLFI